MDIFATKNIRNVCLLGHSADGKTTVAEAMLYLTKASTRIGTVMDYDDEEKKRGFSISASVAPVVRNGHKINVIDAPGYLDFAGEVCQAVRVSDACIIVMDGRAGVEVGTEIAWDKATDAGKPKAILINKIDDPEAKFDRIFAQLKETFGTSVCPFIIPAKENGKTGIIDLIEKKFYTYDAQGKATASDIPQDLAGDVDTYNEALMEEVAGTSDELMEKYFGGEEITRAEVIEGIKHGFLEGSLVPILSTSATGLVGVDILMDTIIDMFPDPSSVKETVVGDDGKEEEVSVSESGDKSVFVFKTVADAYGKMSLFKVMNGQVNSGDELTNVVTGTSEKFAHIYTICGKTQSEVATLNAGDIGLTTKVASLNVNDTLSSKASSKPYKSIVFPQSFYGKAVAATKKGEEDKITQTILKYCECDRTLKFENNPDTKQLVVYGQGDTQIDILISRLKQANINVLLSNPKVSYKETIKGSADVQGKHKKQSGGHGQYGDVWIKFSPSQQEGLEFVQSVVGGAVPKNFYPAVEKGLLEAMNKGVLAGYPVIGLKADLHDGSYHPVDSSEMAFKIAASLAYKNGLPQAKPIILEPIGKVNVYVGNDYVGDVMSALTKCRGRVLGMTPTSKKGETLLEAEAPMSDMSDFSIQLRAITQGRGSYTINYDRYEEVPGDVAQKIIEEAKKNAEEEE